MNLLPEHENQAIEKWFSELKEKLGLSLNADRGRVLARVTKLVTEWDSYENEKRIVAAACGYKRWGDCYSWANSKLVAVPEVELPAVFNTPPNGWVFKRGGDYDKAEKRLVKTQRRLRELWAYLDSELAKDSSAEEWVPEVKSEVIEAFTASTEPDEFDLSLVAFIRGYEEEDPATTWIEAADYAAASLERAYDLPTVATEELIKYAYDAEVEITKSYLAFIENSDFEATRWFDYLLANYLRKTTRATAQEVESVKEQKEKALELWKCYEVRSANDPDRPTMTRRTFAPGVSVAMFEAACQEAHRLSEEGKHLEAEDWRDAIVKAVEAVNNGRAFVIA